MDINPSIPIAGQPNFSEEPKIITALSQLIGTINNLDTANYADASVTAAKLADASVTAAKIEAQQAWQTVALSGLSGSLAYYKDSLGIVRVRADEFSAAGVVPAGTTLFTLPPGYRPGVNTNFVVLHTQTVGSQAMFQAIINTGGGVTPFVALAASPAAYSFSMLTFRAEN